MSESGEQLKLRRYLLNELDEDERALIEERFFVDEEYFERLSMAEENLFQDYADGALDAGDRAKFEKYFLLSEENRQKVKFARALRDVVREEKKARDVKKKPSFFESLTAFLSVRSLAAVLILAVIAGGAFFVLNGSSGDSEVLVALNKAFQSERPVESRISGLDYAPLRNTRGESGKTDKTALELARFAALKAATENPSSENLHALGRVYLAEKQFDKALEQLEKAVRLAPDNARLHNDYGAALMESAKMRNEGRLENLAKANEEFAQAIKLDKNLLEAYFNQALAIQSLNLTNQAREAWQKYLSLDSNSKWSDEARKNLETLKDSETSEMSPDELESDFLAAVGKEEQAFALLTENRELIREKYLPQRLAMSYTQSGGKKNEILRALQYAGELEKARTGDLFASELAAYYQTDGVRRLETLAEAHRSIKSAYEFALKANYSPALAEFKKAKTLFDAAGNIWESRIASHFIAYSNYNANNFDADPELWTENIEFCQKRNFKWLELSNLYWLAGIQDASGEYLDSKKNLEKALALAENCRDQYFLQKIHLASATQSAFFGERQKTLRSLENVLIHTKNKTSARQKWRNYQQIINTLGLLEFYELGSVVAQENIILAKSLSDPIFQADSLITAGSLSSRKKDYEAARQYLTEAQTQTALLDEPATKNFHSAQAALEMGQLERAVGNYRQSLDFFDAAVSFDNNQGFNPFSYAAQKGKLDAYLALGNNEELDKQIPLVLTMAEKYRREILEEQQRSSFFDAEQSVYDLAAEYEFNRGRYEKAYDYSEISSSRSLLDWLQKGVKVSYRNNSNVEVLLKGTSEPSKLNEIRSQIPVQTQILQYSVLENKTLIWLISKDKFEVVATPIKSGELREKVKNYLQSLIEQKPDEPAAARELYDLLVKPVENRLDKAQKICLIPSKSLYYLPFAALRAAGGEPFLAAHELLYSSSANVFLLSTRAARERSDLSAENILSIGNPAFDKRLYPELQNLPQAESEAKQIAALYAEAKVLIGRETTKPVFQALAPKYSVIHFAGHYIAKPGAPLASGLLLSAADANAADSELTNAELIGQPLPKTRLVILSACQTGIEGHLNGEGLIGLARTFLAAGVPVVIASQWKVDSDATAELMKNFHRLRTTDKLSSAAALRRAQLEMLNSSDAKYRSPYFWAAFAVFGGSSDF